MNICDEFRVAMTAHLDGELSEDASAAIQHHIASCKRCAAIFADFNTIHGATRGTTPFEPDDLTKAVRARIDDPAPENLMLEELRLMRKELLRLRTEVADLRHEMARRPPSAVRRSNALSFPDAPQGVQPQYKLV